jgi:DNA sulfur modification protein DndD
MGIKDIFHQTIIMTKDVEIGSDKYNDLIKQDKVSRVFQLDTQSYRSDSKKPEIWEVSTIVKSLK